MWGVGKGKKGESKRERRTRKAGRAELQGLLIDERFMVDIKWKQRG